MGSFRQSRKTRKSWPIFGLVPSAVHIAMALFRSHQTGALHLTERVCGSTHILEVDLGTHRGTSNLK